MKIFSHAELQDRFGGNQDLADAIILDCQIDLPIRLKRISSFMYSHQVEDAGREAHSIAGIAAYIGADILKETAYALENTIKNESKPLNEKLKALSLLENKVFELLLLISNPAKNNTSSK